MPGSCPEYEKLNEWDPMSIPALRSATVSLTDRNRLRRWESLPKHARDTLAHPKQGIYEVCGMPVEPKLCEINNPVDRKLENVAFKHPDGSVYYICEIHVDEYARSTRTRLNLISLVNARMPPSLLQKTEGVTGHLLVW